MISYEDWFKNANDFFKIPKHAGGFGNIVWDAAQKAADLDLSYDDWFENHTSIFTVPNNFYNFGELVWNAAQKSKGNTHDDLINTIHSWIKDVGIFCSDGEVFKLVDAIKKYSKTEAIVKFRWDELTSQYKCSEPGDMSGTYIKINED